MKPVKLILFFVLTFGLSSPAETTDTVGHAKGTLVLVGGGTGKDQMIFRRFVALAGGKNAKIVIVPTAGSSDPNYNYKKPGLANFARHVLKVKSADILHTHDQKEANSDAFIKPLKKATGVWFGGGRQWRLMDAYAGTKTEEAFRQVLDRGGVIGGSSAGATIQGSFLARGDTKGNVLMIGDHQHGFGYLKNAAIDQHVVARKRQFDLIKLLEDPESRMEKSIKRACLLGIGIDENTALVVKGSQSEVIGDPGGVVLIYDPLKWTKDMEDDKKFITIPVGTKYDLTKRKVIHEKASD